MDELETDYASSNDNGPSEPDMSVVSPGGEKTNCSGGEGRNSALVEEEERETGNVSLSVYAAYLRAVGSCLAASVLLALFLMQGTILYSRRSKFLSAAEGDADV